ncbi:MAG: putative ABC transporter ATP-binding protein YfiL [Chloroflexota bacterium]|nr:ABC transporter ATP-binding protein [Ardenticatenaceae bacterium]GIK56935.1 MAG: putative ABC transporter ATP-binding protein YfiL [Chloroflexota bacterium]
MSVIVETQDLRKQYHPPEGPEAVKGVNFSIRRGEIFSLLGPNGAGKSTTIAMLSGLLSPTGGEAVIDGHSITRDAKAVKQVIGVVPQEIALYEAISARENLQFWGRMYGLRGEELQQRVTAVLDIAGLADRANDKVSTFSGGMKRRINIAVGLLHNPKVLYMDEPTVGIDPQSRRRILDTVKELNRQGLTVLYTTHYMEEAEELSHRIGIIDHGELIALGTLAELTDMVGHYDTIRLDVGLPDGANGELCQALALLPGIHQADGDADGRVILQTEDANTILPGVIQHIAGQGLPIRKLEIQEPNLEAVFLHLTGRALRD